jgi:hypothetical protein
MKPSDKRLAHFFECLSTVQGPISGPVIEVGPKNGTIEPQGRFGPYSERPNTRHSITEYIQKLDMSLVFKWLKPNGDHSKTGLKIKFSGSLDHFYTQKNIFLCIKWSSPADH